MERGLRAAALLRRPVVFRDIRLGTVVDGNRRFLSLAACEVEESLIRVASALVLAAEELEFYRNRGRALTAVASWPTVVVDPDGGVISRDSVRSAV